MEEAVDKIGFGVFQVLLSLYLGSTGVSSVCCVFVHCMLICALCVLFSPCTFISEMLSVLVGGGIN